MSAVVWLCEYHVYTHTCLPLDVLCMYPCMYTVKMCLSPMYICFYIHCTWFLCGYMFTCPVLVLDMCMQYNVQCIVCCLSVLVCPLLVCIICVHICMFTYVCLPTVCCRVQQPSADPPWPGAGGHAQVPRPAASRGFCPSTQAAGCFPEKRITQHRLYPDTERCGQRGTEA